MHSRIVRFFALIFLVGQAYADNLPKYEVVLKRIASPKTLTDAHLSILTNARTHWTAGGVGGGAWVARVRDGEEHGSFEIGRLEAGEDVSVEGLAAITVDPSRFETLPGRESAERETKLSFELCYNAFSNLYTASGGCSSPMAFVEQSLKTAEWAVGQSRNYTMLLKPTSVELEITRVE